MISFDFDYYKPSTLDEAIECFNSVSKKQLKPIYYSGGTEIISMARAENIYFDAVIDIKGIPECISLSSNESNLTIGSCVTLTQLDEFNHYPLLSKTSKRIADHTMQGKITIGGNIAGTIKYREIALPLMICDSVAIVMTKNGLKELPFNSIFDGKLNISKEDFLVQIKIKNEFLDIPYMHVKRTKMDKIDYPLITLVAHKYNNKIFASTAGLANNPLIISSKLLNSQNIDISNCIDKILDEMDKLIISDIHGSKEFRKFVFKNMLLEMYEKLEDVK